MILLMVSTLSVFSVPPIIVCLRPTRILVISPTLTPVMAAAGANLETSMQFNHHTNRVILIPNSIAHVTSIELTASTLDTQDVDLATHIKPPRLLLPVRTHGKLLLIPRRSSPVLRKNDWSVALASCSKRALARMKTVISLDVSHRLASSKRKKIPPWM
jgi:hypothetical protein